MLMIFIFVISIIVLPYGIHAQKPNKQTLNEQTLDTIVKQTNVFKGNSQINVGRTPIFLAVDEDTNTIYVTTSNPNTVSVINGTSNTWIKDIHVGKNPSYIAASLHGWIYVANTDSNTVSVINGTSNTWIKDIPVGENPEYIATNGDTSTIYVTNSGSDSISVIDDVSNKVVAGVTFNINPANSGHITCNNTDSPTNQYLYIWSGTICIAKPNNGFEFSNWVENLKHNSTRTLKTSTVSDSPLNSLLNTFGIVQNDTTASFNITRFGSFTANFKALPPPIPPEYWIPLYGVIVSSIVGWSIPSIIGWIRSRKQVRTVHQYYKRTGYLYDDGKLDENDIEPLDKLKTDIKDAYSKGKINDQQYVDLKNEISMHYEKIYKKKVDSLNGKGDLDAVKNDITSAYAEGKINELHYNLINKKISDYENNHKSIDKKLSSQKIATTSTTQGSPIKTNK